MKMNLGNLRRKFQKIHINFKKGLDKIHKRLYNIYNMCGKAQKKKRYTMYTDKTIVCKDCGREFVFSASEQEFFAEKGFTNEPQRCRDCRNARKAQRGEQAPARQMFDAVCADCGKECKVPFEPHDDRPVYCSECFQARRN